MTVPVVRARVKPHVISSNQQTNSYSKFDSNDRVYEYKMDHCVETATKQVSNKIWELLALEDTNELSYSFLIGYN